MPVSVHSREDAHNSLPSTSVAVVTLRMPVSVHSHEDVHNSLPSIATISAEPASQPSDEMHISNEDIDLVMSQDDVSRSRAFTALKDNGNDIVNAIIELTM